jgi:hypothetical protein
MNEETGNVSPFKWRDEYYPSVMLVPSNGEKGKVCLLGGDMGKVRPSEGDMGKVRPSEGDMGKVRPSEGDMDNDRPLGSSRIKRNMYVRSVSLDVDLAMPS